MESLFLYDDYRKFLGDKVASLPNEGYGVGGRLARAIGVHPSLVSQILSGKKQLTPDQALTATDFFGLAELETEYFLLLVQLDRAATPELRAHTRKRIMVIREESQRLANRVEANSILNEEARGIFYSNWMYSAVRQMTAIKDRGHAVAIADALDLPIKEVHQVIEFLLKHGLCVVRDGRLSVGPQSTQLAESSPWVRVHHRNWRALATQMMDRKNDSDLFFTCPLTIGQSDVPRVRELIIQFIEQVFKVVDPSPSEELLCLNIDWFRAPGK